MRPRSLTALAAPLLLLAALVFTAGCAGDGDDLADLPAPIERDLDAILERDTLVVLSMFNSTSYFLYRGLPLGFEYDMLREFADANDLALRVRVVGSRDSLFYLLNAGEGDVVAARVVPSVADSLNVRFTTALYETRPTVVQSVGAPELPDSVDSVIVEGAEASDTSFGLAERIEGGNDVDVDDLRAGELPEQVELRARLIRTPEELAGETVHVSDSSPFEDRLVELSDSLTGDIYVVEVDGVTAEKLIRSVAYNRVDLTVAPERLAELQAEKYSNLAVVPTLGDEATVAWAVRQNAPQLQEALNAFIEGNPGLKANLYRKYFVDRKGYRERVDSKYLSSETGVLSDYDDLFREGADALGWDWRLLASQAYQESRFRPRAQSWAGATGLLQLMPPTARQYGVTDPYDPADNVAGAVRFLEWLAEYWGEKIPDEAERLKFVLASYNTGHGHVEDARRLTAKNGADDTVWEDVAFWLLQKSNPAVYSDPVVRYGFSRGLEPVTYVELILERFDHYRQFVTEEAVAAGLDTRPARPERPPLEGMMGGT